MLVAARASLAATLVLGLATPLVFGHGELHEQIEAITAQLQADPKNAELHLRRGELHRVHGDWPLAAADYEAAGKLAPDLPAVDLVRGRLFLACGAYCDAKTVLDRLIERQPQNPDALVTRARVQAKSGALLEATADFDAAIAAAPRPEPEVYLERAHALAAAGPEHFDAAVRGLDEGLAKLGQPVTLALEAIQLETAAKRYDSALARIDALAARSPRKETWLARRGEILEQAGRGQEARRAFQEALTAIDALPEHRRGTKAMADLRAQVQLKLAPE